MDDGCFACSQGPERTLEVSAMPRRICQGVNPPIRLGGNSTIKGKGITVRKMPSHSFNA